MNIIRKETFVMKLMHKTFLNKGECQYDLTIENGQINENVHGGGDSQCCHRQPARS